MKHLVISLFDHSGNWSRPYLNAGYEVIRVDIKHRNETTDDGGHNLGMDVERLRRIVLKEGLDFFRRLVRDDDVQVYAVLSAPPCTEFALSGAQYWPQKDADGRTEAAKQLVFSTLHLIHLLRPEIWTLENPKGRLGKVMGDMGDPLLVFDPCDYAGWADEPLEENYTKRTYIWGVFNAELKKQSVDPLIYETATGKRGSKHWAKTGGSGAKTKEIRSATPNGFARAFFNANRGPRRS